MYTHRAGRFRLLQLMSGWPRRTVAGLCFLLAGVSALMPPSHRPAGGPTGVVLVAARPLAAGAILTKSDLASSIWPVALIPSSALRSTGPVVGRPLGAAMARGEPLTTTRLLDTSVTSALLAGQVAATVTLADRGQAVILAAGSLIDLYAPSAAGVLVDGRAVDPLPSDPAAGRAVASAVRVLAVLPPQDRAEGGLSLIVAVDRATAAHLANQTVPTLIATLRRPS
jgi:Flp pilus assembly protein CpaB